MEEPNPWLAVTLRARVGESVDPARIADVLVLIVCEVEAALAPALGSRGIELLFRRSLYLSATLQRLPTLQPMSATPLDDAAGMPTPIDFGPLRAMLAQHTGADAITHGTALLQAFYDQLVELVGLPLTERLLRSVWANYSSSVPAPDRG